MRGDPPCSAGRQAVTRGTTGVAYMRTRVLALAAAVALGGPAPLRGDTLSLHLVRNPSFETGDFAGWVHDSAPGTGGPGSAALPWRVGVNAAWLIGAHDGSVSAISGFDGFGPFHHFLYQDVVMPGAWSGGTLTWWDHIVWKHSGLPRTYSLSIKDTADATLECLFSFATTPDPGWTLHDLGWQQRRAAVGTRYAGQAIRIYLDEYIPEGFTGPAAFGVDEFSLLEGAGGSQTPEPATPALFGLGLALAAARRRRPGRRRGSNAG